MEKFLGRASNSGFFAALVGLLAPKGAAAGFFPVPFLTGGWSWRRGHQSRVTVRTVDIARLPGALMLGAQRCHRAQRVRERGSLHDRRLSVFSWGVSMIKLASEIWTHHPAPKSTLSRVTVHDELQVPLANASE